MWHTWRDQFEGGAPDRQPQSTSGFLVGVVPFVWVNPPHEVVAPGNTWKPASTSTSATIWRLMMCIMMWHARKKKHLEVDDVHHDVACQEKKNMTRATNLYCGRPTVSGTFVPVVPTSTVFQWGRYCFQVGTKNDTKWYQRSVLCWQKKT